MSYNNPCGTSKQISVSWKCTKSFNTGGGSASGSFSVTVPTGSGNKTGTASLGGTECTCNSLALSAGISDYFSGNC